MNYQFGKRCALRKLGMLSSMGPNYYAGASTPTNAQFTADARQMAWKEMDNNPLFTGEESGIGMPSAPKTGSFTADTSSDAGGVVADGSFDGYRFDPERAARLLDSINRGFQTNEAIDGTTAPEPGMASPKLANSFFNAGSSLRPGALGPRSSSQLMGKTVPSMGKPGGGLNSALNPLKMPTVKPPTGVTQPALAGNAHMNLQGNAMNATANRSAGMV